MKTEENKKSPGREGGDEALTNLENQKSVSTDDKAGYSNEERVSEDAEAPNLPTEKDDDPAGSGIPSKE